MKECRVCLFKGCVAVDVLRELFKESVEKLC